MVLAMRNMYQTPVGRLMIGSGAHKALLDLTRREGRYMNSPASVKVSLPFLCLSACLCICLPCTVRLSVCLYVCLFCESARLAVFLSFVVRTVHPPVCMSVVSSVCPFVCLPVHSLSAWLSVHLSVCLPVWGGGICPEYILIVAPQWCAYIDGQ